MHGCSSQPVGPLKHLSGVSSHNTFCTLVTASQLTNKQQTAGFGFSFGVFQDYYSTHEPFGGSGNIASIGTSTMVSWKMLLTLFLPYG